MKTHVHDKESVSSEIEVMRGQVKNLDTGYVTSFLSQFPILIK